MRHQSDIYQIEALDPFFKLVYGSRINGSATFMTHHLSKSLRTIVRANNLKLVFILKLPYLEPIFILISVLHTFKVRI